MTIAHPTITFISIIVNRNKPDVYDDMINSCSFQIAGDEGAKGAQVEDVRELALASLREARSAHNKAKRELTHLQDAIAALLSLHNVSATRPVLSVPLHLRYQCKPVTLEITQTPDRGVGGLLWQSSVVLAESLSTLLHSFMLADPQRCCHDGDVNGGPVVIELGAGAAALPSLAAAALLPASATVIATDLPDITGLTRRTVRELLPLVASAEKQVLVRECSWGDCLPGPSHATAATAQLGPEDVKAVDNRVVLPPADVLLGADLLYVERCHEDLVSAISRLLKPGGLLLLSYAQRDSASEQRFFSLLLARVGLCCEVAIEPCVRDGQTVHTVLARRGPGGEEKAGEIVCGEEATAEVLMLAINDDDGVHGVRGVAKDDVQPSDVGSTGIYI